MSLGWGIWENSDSGSFPLRLDMKVCDVMAAWESGPVSSPGAPENLESPKGKEGRDPVLIYILRMHNQGINLSTSLVTREPKENRRLEGRISTARGIVMFCVNAIGSLFPENKC